MNPPVFFWFNAKTLCTYFRVHLIKEKRAIGSKQLKQFWISLNKLIDILMVKQWFASQTQWKPVRVKRFLKMPDCEIMANVCWKAESW